MTLRCDRCRAEFGLPRTAAQEGDLRALEAHRATCTGAQLERVRPYVVSLLSNDSTGTIRDVVVYAYTAADAVTQMEIEQRGSIPGARVYRVNPRR